MRKVSLVLQDEAMLNNNIFNKNFYLNRDQTSDRYIELKNQFLKYGYDLSTYDINDFENSEIIIYIDLDKKFKFKKGKKQVLFLGENEMLYGHQYKMAFENSFDKVFTWNNKILDNKKFFKYNFSYYLDFQNFNQSKKRKLSVMINSNKFVNHPKEIYSERVNLINWFEKNNPTDFDLFGEGWNRYLFKYYPLTFFNRFSKLRSYINIILRKNFRVYMGGVSDKRQILCKYKFAFCFENSDSYCGYITEKIFDAFFSGTIPIYFGAPDIQDYIPKNCYIDYRQFHSTDELVKKLKSIGPKDLIDYQNNIKKFLKSKRFDQFELTLSTKKIIDTILK